MIAALCSQVYFGYGLSFIFGIYVTQLDLFGLVQMLLLREAFIYVLADFVR